MVQVSLELPLELLRLLAGLGLLVYSILLMKFFKGGLMHRAWTMMVGVSVVILVWSASAILDDLGLVEEATETILVKFLGFVLVLVLFVFAAEFYHSWKKAK